MKRWMCLLAFLISIGTSAFGQVVKEVTLSSTTNLAAALENEEPDKITTLKISGPLTTEDFATMKNDMAMLQVLDMSGVTVLPEVSSHLEDQQGLHGIPYSTFQSNTSLQQVLFPVCLQSIGGNAFAECISLQSVQFPEGCQLKIVNPYAFYESRAIISMDFSHCKELISIGEYSFRQSSQLYEVNLKGCSKLELIGTGCFQECKTLEKIDFTGCQSLKSIGKLCFYYTALQNVSLADCIKLESIDDEAFRSVRGFSFSQFEKLSSLKTIGSLTFANTSISGDISFPSSIVSVGANAFEGLALSSISFQNCTQLQTISVKAFSNCSVLQTVQLENCPALSTLHQTAFDGCNGLKAISVSGNNNYESADGVLIDNRTHTLLLYPSSKSATEYTIPDAVTSIANGSFPYNSSIKRLVIPTTVESIEPGTFANTAFSDGYAIIEMLSSTPLNLTGSIGLEGAKVCVPAGAAELYKLADYWKDCRIIAPVEGSVEVTLANAGSLLSELSDVVLSSITELTVNGPMNASDFEVIKQMTLLTKVDLGETSMEGDKLPNNAFSGLSYLKEVRLPNSIKEIGQSAFVNLSNLEAVNLPSMLERIGVRAFNNCSSMKEIDLSTFEHIQYIGDYAFANCTAIPAVLKLPTSIDHIDWYAFSGTRVVSLECLNTALRQIGRYAFSGCVITGNLSFPATLRSIEDNAFNAAKPTSIKLKSAEMVSLGGTDVFKATDKLSCIVHVPKGLEATYRADTYWSPFGKIEEFGNLVVTTVNDNSYGSVNGGGAYEKDERVTLTAVCNEDYWSTWRNSIFLFAGWYDGDNKVADEATYTFTMGESDKAVAAHFERIYLESSDSRFPLTYKDRTAKSITVTVDLSNIGEVELFQGWYDNNDQLISRETSITVSAGEGDRAYSARINNGQLYIGSTTTIDDAFKVDGQKVFIDAALTVTGNKTWNLKSFEFTRRSAVVVESPITAEHITYYCETQPRRWSFICLPYDLKMVEINPGEGSQFVVREYDGTSRANKGMGSSWKQLGANDVLKANQGYIIQFNGYTMSPYNASSGMEALFNRQAVTIDLPRHASTVPADANWNLVGNPFPCYFSVKQLFNDGLDGTVTVWSDQIQNYEYYTKDDEDVYLAPLTAFFIQHNQAANVTFKPEGRVAPLPTTRAAVADLRSDTGREVINLQLANDSLSDKTRLVFNEAASTDYELGKDAAKFSSLNNNAPSLYTLDAQNQQLAINERPVGNGVVRLGCYIGVKGSYTISVKEALASDLYLYDAETGAFCNLREESYAFTAEAGVCNNRFELRTALKGTGIEAIEGLSWQVVGHHLQLNGLPAGAQVSLFDANGRAWFAGDAATATQGIALPQSGIYYLTIRTAEGRSFTEAIKR